LRGNAVRDAPASPAGVKVVVASVKIMQP
jgi:hypothetical protein